uniref:G-protein coupled receptors family 1 profile domain-containing protein n=1 Tax=Knipowitschia caucasica TaxID=637954 RepID=A0AAV2IZ06_KNICA
MPLWINYYNQDHHWRLGPISCSIAGFFYYSNMYISIYLLCCISVDRCLVVTYPFRSKTHRTSRYAWLQCLGVYVVVTLLHAMVLYCDNLTDAHDEVNGNDRCYETFPMTLNCVVDPVLYVLVSNGVQKEVKTCWTRRTQTQTEDCVI